MADAIVRKRLMTLKKVSGAKRKAFAILILAWVCVVLFGNRFGGFPEAFGLGLGYGLCSPFLLAMLVSRCSVSRAKTMSVEIKAVARAHIVSMAGGEPRYIDINAVSVPSAGRSLVGTGIAYDGEKIYVMDAGEVAVIPWSTIRDWTWKTDGYSQTEAFGAVPLGTRLAVNDSNRNASVRALHGSGFFVTVADVDKPVWQFMTRDKAVLDKWTEIFQQIKEGRLQVA